MNCLSLSYLLALALPVFGQDQEYYTTVAEQSAPFKLQLISDDQILNGGFVSALHQGAGLEAIGYYPGDFFEASTFYLNTTVTTCTIILNGSVIPCPDFPPSPSNATLIGNPGALVWNLPVVVDGMEWVSQDVTLAPRGISSHMNFLKISWPTYFPVDYGALGVAFDTSGCMNLQDNLNPPENDPSSDENKMEAYYRWYICLSWWNNYRYDHLIWVSGAGEPEVPGCSKVGVKRVWA